MEIYLNRKGLGQKESDISTPGELEVGGTTVYTLEDDYDSIKEYGKSRIPAGRYEIKLRLIGSTHEAYKTRFADIHKGTLYLQNVPGYDYILIHCGNTVLDTLGCILVGSKSLGNKITGSEIAYRKIYPLIANPLSKGEQVFINIID